MIIYNKEGDTLLRVEVNDNSYRYRTIMGENSLTLYFSLPQFVEIPLGAYCEFQGERYTLIRPESLKMLHTRYFEYVLQMESEQHKFKLWKFRNPTDDRIKFPLTAKPQEHLEYLIKNLAMRGEKQWQVGECIKSEERLVNYDNVYLWQALELMAKTFETEFEINGHIISLRKVERNKDTPLPLSYGKGKGFVSGVSRNNYGDTPPIEILYVLGGERNIDSSKYGDRCLRLPRKTSLAYDGRYFEDEEGFNEREKRIYQTDEKGLFVKRADKVLSSLAEDTLDCTTIYPKRVGEVTALITIDEAKNLYDIVDATIPDNLDFEKQLIAGEKMTIIFQSGTLAGREFEVKYIHNAQANKRGKRFEIVAQTEDGTTMPNSTFKPQKGDKYAVFHCNLPQSYINAYEGEGTPKQGAEWEMMRTAIRYLHDHEEANFSFSGQLDGIWAKKNWANIGGQLQIGNIILFQDDRFLPDGINVRITGVKEYINNPHAPEIDLSNTPVGSSFSTTIKKLESQKIDIEERHKESVLYTKRRYRDAQESMALLESGLFNNFTKSVNPAAVQTMQMLVGDESLQFDFLDTAGGHKKELNAHFDTNSKQFTCDAALLCHYTLGISAISSERSPKSYKRWNIPHFESGTLDEGGKAYFLYAICPIIENGIIGTGRFGLSENKMPLRSENDFNLLVGILNSEYNNERTFTPLFGFTEILPNRITTDKILSADGETYFDLSRNEIGGKINFKDGLVSGSVGVGNGKTLNAGLNGVGKQATDVRFWAGSGFDQKEKAPFQVLQNGSLIASKANITGEIHTNTGFIGDFKIANGGITSVYNNNYNGFSLTKNTLSFQEENHSYINSATIGGMSALDYPYTARFILNGKNSSHNGTALYVSNTIPNETGRERRYIRRAIFSRGDVYGIGRACFYHKGYIGAVSTDVIEVYFNITHKYHFTENDTSRLEVRLPTKEMIDQKLGEDAGTFFNLEIVADREMKANFFIFDRDEAPIIGWAGNRRRKPIEIGGGGVLALRYYNGAYTILHSNVCTPPNGTKAPTILDP